MNYIMNCNTIIIIGGVIIIASHFSVDICLLYLTVSVYSVCKVLQGCLEYTLMYNVLCMYMYNSFCANLLFVDNNFHHVYINCSLLAHSVVLNVCTCVYF